MQRLKPAAHLFLDCDGVLADFDALAESIFDMPPRQYEEIHGSTAFWNGLREWRSGGGLGFFRCLPLMSDAMQLWEATKHLKPTILTGCPRGLWAEQQKRDWVLEHFGAVEIITCESKNKVTHIYQPGDILVDDWPQYTKLWEASGGVFVLHTTAESSIRQLQSLQPEWFEGA